MDNILKKVIPYLLATAALVGLYLSSIYNYLLFHSLAELFSVVIAVAMFMIAWNGRQFMENHFFLFIGLAFLFIGGMDLVHMLSYEGMPLFPNTGANEATQLWIAARYMQSLSLLASPFFLNRRMNVAAWLSGYAVITLLLVLSIFSWRVFPDCFKKEIGLTPFKRYSEVAISVIFMVSAIRLYANRSRQNPEVLRWLLTAIGFSVAGEIVFTGYVSVYSAVNLAGHYFKILSFFFIYKAVIQTGLTRPYALMFRELKNNETALQNTRRKLADKVKDRTKELQAVVDDLHREVGHRIAVEKKLRQMSRKSIDALESDRQSMSKELHDSIGASLSAIKLLLEDIAAEIKQKEKPHERLEMAINYLAETIQETKRISAGLRPLTLEDLGLVSTIQSYSRQFSDLYQDIGVNLHMDAVEKDIPEYLKIVIYRILQEALNNAGKHSGAEHVQIRLSADEHRIEFEVADDGIGFEPSRQDSSDTDLGGHGLQGMRERTEIIGGRFHLSSAPGAGTTIRIVFSPNASVDDPSFLPEDRKMGTGRHTG